MAVIVATVVIIRTNVPKIKNSCLKIFIGYSNTNYYILFFCVV